MNITPKFNALKLGDHYQPRIRSNDSMDVKERIKSLEDELVRYARQNSELQKKIVEGFNQNQTLLNTQKREIAAGSEAQATTIVSRIVSGGSGGSTPTATSIVTASVSLTAGVATPIVFSAPAQLLSVPIGYATVEGLVSAEILAPSALTVAGFTLTSLNTCVCIYSYKLL
jgi:hypothetical protein